MNTDRNNIHIEDGKDADSESSGSNSSADIADENGDKVNDGNDAEQYKLDVAQKEDKWVWWLRCLIGILLFGVAVTVCLLVYFAGRQNETDSFHQDFSALSKKLVMSFEQNVKQRFEVLASFADGITSEANGTWPFVTPPNFSARAERVAKLAQIMVFHLMPLVTRPNLDAWNEYSIANSQWRPEGMAREKGIPLDQVNATEYEPFLYNPYVQPGTNVPTEEINPDGPYFPIWLSYPVSDYAIANLDLFSDWEHIVPINKTVQTQKPIFEYTYDYQGHMERDIRWDFIVGNKFVDYQDDPHGTAIVPIFDGFSENKTVAAVLMAYIYWREYFDDLLPPGADGVIVILENTCNQSYTYQVDGVKSSWLGRGDRHESKYDYLEAGTSVNGIFTEDGEDPIKFEDDTESDILYYDCFYNIRVYPSQEFEDRYRSSRPFVQAVILAGLFLFTSTVFLFYDYMVERRQKLVLQSALQSGELVSSLFPAQVRERLYEEQKNHLAHSNNDWKVLPGPSSEPNGPTAIASLYPETTIFFGDLVGFTSWSAKRTPTQVFELLEAIYGCFDKVARKRKIFKIETIGDCYVAVAGLPDPQPDHAMIMCKFANECLQKLQSLLDTLSESLGEDTKELGMRVGLHSGQVTAGVLRGEKSRFQLFGDSVNTASRMESNGIKGMIHVSQETADALVAGGKEQWLTPREDKITAKGKGLLDTYFVSVSSPVTTANKSMTSSSDPN